MRRRVRGLLARTAGRHPHAAVRVASLLGWATGAAGHGLDEAKIRRYFPELDARAVQRIRRATWTSWLRLRVLEAAVASSTARWPYPPLTSDFDPSGFRPPMILTSFHVGPISALGGALEQLPGEVLVLHVSGAPRGRLRMLSVGPTQWDRAAAFAQAMCALRAGGFVFLLADANVFPSTIEATMFGRTIRLARGAFALSRLSGAPVVALAGRWRGARVEVVASDPIAPADEISMAAAIAAWLERFVRASPGEMGEAFADSFWGDD
jgi:hypothetical protein